MDRWTISNATLKYKDTITLEFITKPTVLGLLDHSPPFVLPMTDTTSQQFRSIILPDMQTTNTTTTKTTSKTTIPSTGNYGHKIMITLFRKIDKFFLIKANMRRMPIVEIFKSSNM